MKYQVVPFRGLNITSQLWHLISAAAILAGFATGNVSAETHVLRSRGKTFVEAEHYSAVSDVPPKIESSSQCSGQSNLEYFWANSWFELEVDSRQMLNYRASLRAASDKGTEIEIQAINTAGRATRLARINVPGTGSYTDYQISEDVPVTLPAGVQTLRFKNLHEGVNVDFVTFTAGSPHDLVTVRPSVANAPDINPLKGFNSGWWRNDTYASVGFQYIEWGKLEPTDDFFDWDYIEKEVLNRPGSRGRHLILQFVVDWDQRDPVDANYLGPDWLRPMVGEVEGTADPTDANSRKMRATSYNDPVFIEEAIEAIGALCNRYKDDPRTFVIQVGAIGFWGEWHTFPREDWAPSPSTKNAILDAYMKNLGLDCLTQVRFPDEPICIPQPGIGYANGSATLTEDGKEFGKSIARRTLWKNGPIGGEWPPDVDPTLCERFFTTDEGPRFIRQARYSTMLPPEPKEIVEKLPSWKQDAQFMSMHRMMGYNFQVEAVRHLVSADDSSQAHIEVDLHNIGIAPFYKKWAVQLAIINSDTLDVAGLVETDTDLRTLGPDSSTTIVGSCLVKLDPRAKYQIGLRILQPDADKPKPEKWKLDPRNVYIALANDIKVIKGEWNESGELKNSLQGGWNLISDIKHRVAIPLAPMKTDRFPFKGSFRP